MAHPSPSLSTPSPATTASSIAVSQVSFDPFGLATVAPPPPPKLSQEQLKQCSEALSYFNKEDNVAAAQLEKFNKLQATMGECIVGEANENKNRHKNVMPYDDTRVILNASDNKKAEGSDYINASLVTVGPAGKVSRFIATQGPIPETFDDFWQMIYQYRCSVIVMLTHFGKGKMHEQCSNYIKLEKGQGQFGKIHVTSKSSVVTTSSLVLRCLELQCKDAMEPPLPVLHIEYPEWPDYGAPSSSVVVREILRRMYHVPNDAGPIVVHFSAGVGRTGTYCVIHNIIQRILLGDTSSWNVVKTIADFRSQRMRMVYKPEQFLFCYKAIVDELKELLLRSNQ